MTTILIKSFEEKETQKGKKYHLFETNEGKMSCFDDDLAKILVAQVGKNINVDYSQTPDGKFKNIKKFLSLADSVEVVKMSDKFAEAREKKNTTMYVSYAKDIFCALIESAKENKVPADEVMEMSISLVKQAQTAFE